MTRLAAEVHLSVRALQAGFQREYGVPPTVHLRDLRLGRARAELTVANPQTTTVRTVALSLGFLHQGRFAAAYRERYGESPSDTLRRVTD